MKKKLTETDIIFNNIIAQIKVEKSVNNYDEILKELFSDDYTMRVNNTLYTLDADNKLYVFCAQPVHSIAQMKDETVIYQLRDETVSYEISDETKVYTRYKTISLF